MSDTFNLLIVGAGMLSMVGIFTSMLYALYIRKKWLPEVEVMFRGYDLQSRFLYFAILACIQYGGAFSSHFLAKRTKMLKAREVVPAKIQKHFIVFFWVFMVSTVLMFASGYIVSEYTNPGNS